MTTRSRLRTSSARWEREYRPANRLYGRTCARVAEAARGKRHCARRARRQHPGRVRGFGFQHNRTGDGASRRLGTAGPPPPRPRHHDRRAASRFRPRQRLSPHPWAPARWQRARVELPFRDRRNGPLAQPQHDLRATTLAWRTLCRCCFDDREPCVPARKRNNAPIRPRKPATGIPDLLFAVAAIGGHGTRLHPRLVRGF